jgi:hypothetical protein
MPSCGEGSSCKEKLLPLKGRHACGLCDVKLHRICGCFYNEDNIKYQNICSLCKVALDRKNHDLEIHGFPPLPFPMTPQEAAELLPEILQKQQPVATPHPVSERPPLPPHQPQAKKRSIVAAPLASKKSKKGVAMNNTVGTTVKKGVKVDTTKKLAATPESPVASVSTADQVKPVVASNTPVALGSTMKKTAEKVKPVGRVRTPITRTSPRLSALAGVIAESEKSTSAKATRTDAATKVATAVNPTQLPFETSDVADKESFDCTSPDQLGELLVSDMDKVHDDISPGALNDVNGDVADTPSAGTSADKLHCSYKKWNYQLATKEQIPCVVQSCKKKYTQHVFTIIYAKVVLILR